MVSRKWTCQLSLELTLPMAAAHPPSAITVWALPNSDLLMMAVFLPCWRASIAARRPAPPAPITTTSKEYRSISFPVVGAFSVDSVISVSPSVHEPRVGEPAGRHRHHVEVGQRQGAQRRP